jgi:hypothetical protein
MVRYHVRMLPFKYASPLSLVAPGKVPRSLHEPNQNRTAMHTDLALLTPLRRSSPVIIHVWMPMVGQLPSTSWILSCTSCLAKVLCHGRRPTYANRGISSWFAPLINVANLEESSKYSGCLTDVPYTFLSPLHRCSIKKPCPVTLSYPYRLFFIPN